MATKKIAKFYDANGNRLYTDAIDIIDRSSGANFSEHVANKKVHAKWIFSTAGEEETNNIAESLENDTLVIEGDGNLAVGLYIPISSAKGNVIKRKPDGIYAPAMTQSKFSDFDAALVPGFYYKEGATSNCPEPEKYGDLACWALTVQGSGSTDRCVQTATQIFNVGGGANRTFTRTCHDGIWSEWKDITSVSGSGSDDPENPSGPSATGRIDMDDIIDGDITWERRGNTVTIYVNNVSFNTMPTGGYVNHSATDTGLPAPVNGKVQNGARNENTVMEDCTISFDGNEFIVTCVYDAIVNGTLTYVTEM